MAELSILIPARNEMFLTTTVKNIMEKKRGDTEIIVVCDGNYPHEPIDDDKDIQMIYHSESIGQRAATNEAAKMSRAKYIMKADAHCSFDEGFDIKMIEVAKEHYNWTLIPRMYNLHAFNWRCKKCNHEKYQGPTPTKCEKCENTTDFERVIYWREKHNPTSDFMRFDSELHFQYWMDFKKRPEAIGDIVPSMSLIGACWMMNRERYWELGGMDEEHGSWGQMGTEIACKSWLSDGALMTNRKTWFAHMFRTQGGDFGFPYPNPGIMKARKRSKDLWLNGIWPKAIHPLSWLIEKFAPVPDWDEEKIKQLKKKEAESGRTFNICDNVICNVNVNDEVGKEVGGLDRQEDRNEKSRKGTTKKSKGMIYYTDNRLDKEIMWKVQGNLFKCCNNGNKIVSVSLKPINFGNNIVLQLERGYLTMFKQILAGLEAIDSDIVFFCEHDVLYHKSHFDFEPLRTDMYYYNENLYQVNSETGQSVFFKAKRTSQLCAYRDLLIEHYKKRVNIVETTGFSRKMGFEPGSHNREERVDDYKADIWYSEFPNVDIKHGRNLTEARWDPSQFRSQRSCRGWKDVDEVPGWGKIKGRFRDFLKEV